MKKLFHVVCFFLVTIVLILIIDYETGDNIYYNPVWQKIQSGKHIDVLIMGNSHVFTSYDARVLSQVSNKEIDCLASGSQNMVGAVVSLETLLIYQKPSYIVLDLYSACINSREELQSAKQGQLYQTLDGIDNYSVKFFGVNKLFMPQDIISGTLQLFRPVYRWQRFTDKKVNDKDEYGFIMRDTYASGENILRQVHDRVVQIYTDTRERDTFTDYNEAAYRKFLEITKANNIKVVLTNIPCLEPNISAKIKQLFYISQEYDNVIYKEDFTLSDLYKDLNVEDYYDTSHFNRRGAEKFTRFFAKKVLHDKMGYSLDWSNVDGYMTESIKQTGEKGYYVYEMTNYAKEVQYRFIVKKDKKIVDKTKFSSNNKFTGSYSPYDKNVEIICEMKRNGKKKFTK